MIVGLESKGRGLEVHDFLSAALFFVFAFFSLLWPDTAGLPMLGHLIPRGYIVAIVLSLLGFIFLSMGRLDLNKLPGFFQFLRMFYPQAYFAFLFQESILLSAPASRGGSYDFQFAKLDFTVFGFQPSREFSRAFDSIPAVNELMFGAYFSFFLLLTLTPWIAWIKGDRQECRKQMAALSAYMCIVYVFYVFFRVMGPKYYFADLNAQWYDHFQGGFFTGMLKGVFKDMTLSGSAFPSSHVAVSILMTFFVWRNFKPLLPLYIILNILIACATVYLYAHWAADIAGGVVLTLLLVPFLRSTYDPATLLVASLNTRLGYIPSPSIESFILSERR